MIMIINIILIIIILILIIEDDCTFKYHESGRCNKFLRCTEAKKDSQIFRMLVTRGSGRRMARR